MAVNSGVSSIMKRGGQLRWCGVQEYTNSPGAELGALKNGGLWPSIQKLNVSLA